MTISKGTRVTYQHWGATETALVVSLSSDGKIVFLANGRWKHLESVTAI